MDKLVENRGYFKGKRSVLATIFLNPSILHINYTSYWKATSLIQEKGLPEGEFVGTAIQKIIGGLEFNFLKKNNKIRDTQLVSNKKNHPPFALMEKMGQPDKIYQRIDCTLVVKEKTMHASKKILIGQVNQQRKTIKLQKELIIDLKKCLKEKIEKEEEVSDNIDNIANIAHIVAKDIINKSIDFFTFHPIFQELIHIQTGE
ncbi:hypothetical protein C1645_819313 [Glomus cerebriforme]|uniref:Uncharacterized protein n=1 Tax=Glomus cerebriforme TaxID=658196 RepID=A0A397T6J1_9GLOM|nr:hypothetical protein C1645_819313 [Glomus cerebriforme]